MNRCDICNFFLDENAFVDYVEDGHNVCIDCQREFDDLGPVIQSGDFGITEDEGQ
jgi:hypothetical protein